MTPAELPPSSNNPGKKQGFKNPFIQSRMRELKNQQDSRNRAERPLKGSFLVEPPIPSSVPVTEVDTRHRFIMP